MGFLPDPVKEEFRAFNVFLNKAPPPPNHPP
jgi:hypothetical protein